MAPVIDGMMHLESVGEHWDGLLEAVIDQYDAAGVDQGVVMATWMPSRESNDLVAAAHRRYPDRLIPFGHVRPVDDWRSELGRITQEFGWTGLKLHQGELSYATDDLGSAVREIVTHAAELGLRLVKLHLENYEAIDHLTAELPEVTWILPHLGCYHHPGTGLRRYCQLARTRSNVYLDTSATAQYYNLDLAVRWAGVDKLTFASDGFLYDVAVEKAKIDALRHPTPHRCPPLTDDEYQLIMGGNMARLLGLTP